MLRIVSLSNKYYGLEIDDIYDDLENIEAFLETGDAVLLCNEKYDVSQFGIDFDDIKIVNREQI